MWQEIAAEEDCTLYSASSPSLSLSLLPLCLSLLLYPLIALFEQGIE